MSETVNLEQTLLETVRSLSPSKQEAVLHFARSLKTSQSESLSSHTQQNPPPLTLSLQQIAKLPVRDRNQLLTPYVFAMAEDFQTDPELTEFSVLDTEDWED
jgi:hypothetical protein